MLNHQVLKRKGGLDLAMSGLDLAGPLNYTLSRSLTPTSHLQGQFESAMRYYANSIDNSISACGQLVLMLNVASQTFDSAG